MFNFEAIKRKYIHDTDVKVFVGNADEIRALISTMEDQAETIEMYKIELKNAKDRELSYIDNLEQVEGMLSQANERIKELEEKKAVI
jgi:hypothetical protein